MSFERAAAFYDATRAIPQDELARALDALASALEIGPGSRVLEPAVGTGRIAAPLAVRSFARVVGFDLSPAMLARARGKRLRDVLLADATRVPVRDRTFDAVVFAHALHLIPDWRRALAEARRVLRPRGRIAVSFGFRESSSPLVELRAEAKRHARASGLGVAENPGAVGHEEVAAEMRRVGWSAEEVEGARWSSPVTPREILTRVARDQYSYTWALSPDAKERLVAHLDRFAREKWGSLDVPVEEDARVVWDVFEP